MKFENDERILKRRERIKVKPYDLFIKQVKQIEEWIELEYGEVIFDSNIDNWKEKTSTFDSKIMNEEVILFLL